MEVFDELAHADLEAESGYNLTEANLIKVRDRAGRKSHALALTTGWRSRGAVAVLCAGAQLLQVAQLLLQFMQWNVEQGAHACQLLQEERSGVLSGQSAALCGRSTLCLCAMPVQQRRAGPACLPPTTATRTQPCA